MSLMRLLRATNKLIAFVISAYLLGWLAMDVHVQSRDLQLFGVECPQCRLCGAE